MSDKDHHYEGVTGARKTGSLIAWQDFEGELKRRKREIAAMLPTHISRERFNSSAIAAVKQNPDLLTATPRSLFGAITKSAQDGILPDGREGIISVYGNVAQWNPMTYGLRKRARELDGILIDAQVVQESDSFIWHQGDNPHIEHIPAKLGTPRGEMIGVYAIFKRENGTVLHREVLDKADVEAIRSQSRAKDSLMWTKFAKEGWRKSAIRRGIKSVPVSETLEAIIRRDDESFDFTQASEQTSTTVTPPRPAKSDFVRKTEVTEVHDPVTGEILSSHDSGPVTVALQSEMHPEGDEPSGETPGPSADFAAAEETLRRMVQNMAEVDDLDGYKKAAATNIASFEHLTDEERSALRGRFNAVILNEKKKRSLKGGKS